MRKQLLSLVLGLAAMLGISVSANAATITFTQNGPAPPPSIQTAGGWDGGYINMTQEVNSQSNQVSFDQLVTGSYKQMKFDFDFRFSVGQGGGADGVGFVYANSANYGTTGNVAGWGTGEEPSLAGSLGVGFDTFNNADQGDGGESSVSLHFNNARLASTTVDGTVLGTFEDGNVHHASISVVPVAGGSNVSVTVSKAADSLTIFDNYFVAGLDPYDGRMAFHGRTGGANSKQDLDNIQLMHVAGANDPTTTVLYEFIPEPTSVTLIGIGVAGLLGLIRRR
jgi:hypothetical protein